MTKQSKGWQSIGESRKPTPNLGKHFELDIAKHAEAWKSIAKHAKHRKA